MDLLKIKPLSITDIDASKLDAALDVLNYLNIKTEKYKYVSNNIPVICWAIYYHKTSCSDYLFKNFIEHPQENISNDKFIERYNKIISRILEIDPFQQLVEYSTSTELDKVLIALNHYHEISVYNYKCEFPTDPPFWQFIWCDKVYTYEYCALLNNKKFIETANMILKPKYSFKLVEDEEALRVIPGSIAKEIPQEEPETYYLNIEGFFPLSDPPNERLPKTNWPKRFLELCDHLATWSKDPSTRVAAIIVDNDKNVRTIGYNGLCRGIKDTVDRLNDREQKYLMTSHAENNALINSARLGIRTDGCTLVCTHFPCATCAGSIINAGIKSIITRKSTEDFSERWQKQNEIARIMFQEAGVEIVELE